MNELQTYDAAKEEFRKHYIKSYPMPARRPIPDLPTMQDFWRSPMVWVTIFIAIAAAFMSALRTFHVLDTVDSKAGAIAGIIVIEGMAGLISFFLVLRKYKESGKTESGIRGFMLILTYGAISLGLLTNVYSIMLHQHKVFTNIEWAVVIMAGSIAVFAIAILMHILGTLYVSILEDFDKATVAYKNAISYTEECLKDDLQAWTDEFEAQWKKPTNQRKYIGMVNTSYQQQIAAMGASSGQRTTPVNFAMSSVRLDNGQVDTPTMGFGYIAQSSASSGQRTTPVFDSVYQEFVKNPELVKLPLRTIQAQIETKASVETINQARRAFNIQQNQNDLL